MIPILEKSGLLPSGIHWASWAEVENRYATNPHRVRLLGGLKRGIAALTAAGCQTLYLDGSFVTDKLLPNDYDACWDIAGVNSKQLDPVFLDFRNMRAAQKAKYLGEFFPAHLCAEATPLFRTYIDFFQRDKDTGDPKGIIGLVLKGQP